MTANYVKIGDVATVESGYTFRTSITSTQSDNVNVIQAKNISPSLLISSSFLDTTNLDYSNIKAIVRNGDLVLSSRGRFKAAIAELDNPTVASSSIFIIRTNKLMNSYFLAIYINSNIGQLALSKITSGAYIKSLLKRNLLSLKVPLPDLKTQKQIVQLHKNIFEQERLLKRVVELNSNIGNYSINHTINN